MSPTNAALGSKFQIRLRLARRHALRAWLFLGALLAGMWGVGIGMGPCGPSGLIGYFALAVATIGFAGVVVTTFSAFSGIARVWTHTRVMPNVPMPGLLTLFMSIGVWGVMLGVFWYLVAH